jgi:hypothetical protein
LAPEQRLFYSVGIHAANYRLKHFSDALSLLRITGSSFSIADSLSSINMVDRRSPLDARRKTVDFARLCLQRLAVFEHEHRGNPAMLEERSGRFLKEVIDLSRRGEQGEWCISTTGELFARIAGSSLSRPISDAVITVIRSEMPASTLPFTAASATGSPGANSMSLLPLAPAGSAGASPMPELPPVATGFAGASATPELRTGATGSAGASSANQLRSSETGFAGASSANQLRSSETGFAGASSTPELPTGATGFAGASSAHQLRSSETGFAGESSTPELQAEIEVGGQRCHEFFNYLPQDIWSLQLDENVKLMDKTRHLCVLANALGLLFPDGETVAVMAAITGSAGMGITGTTSLAVCDEIKTWLLKMRKRQNLQKKDCVLQRYPELPQELPLPLYARAYARQGPGVCPFSAFDMRQRSAMVALRSTHASVVAERGGLADSRLSRQLDLRSGATNARSAPWLPAGAWTGSAGLWTGSAGATAARDPENGSGALAKHLVSAGGTAGKITSSAEQIGALVMQELQRGPEGLQNLHHMISRAVSQPASDSERGELRLQWSPPKDRVQGGRRLEMSPRASPPSSSAAAVSTRQLVQAARAVVDDNKSPHELAGAAQSASEEDKDEDERQKRKGSGPNASPAAKKARAAAKAKPKAPTKSKASAKAKPASGSAAAKASPKAKVNAKAKAKAKAKVTLASGSAAKAKAKAKAKATRLAKDKLASGSVAAKAKGKEKGITKGNKNGGAREWSLSCPPPFDSKCPLRFNKCRVYHVEREHKWRVYPSPGSRYDKAFHYDRASKKEVWASMIAYCKHPEVPASSVNYKE